jgi:uncharacterized membrane protein YccC
MNGEIVARPSSVVRLCYAPIWPAKIRCSSALQRGGRVACARADFYRTFRLGCIQNGLTGTAIVRPITRFWMGLRSFVRHSRAQLVLSIRATTAAVASLVLAQLLDVPLPLWAVLTALIVTQLSIGRALKVTFDYLAGTLGGAIYGGVIGVLFPHANEIMFLAVLALAVAPLAFVAAINPRFSVAPITAVIVLLVPTFTNAGPVDSAVDRVIEVAIGGASGFAVSFLLLPSNAHSLVVEAAARTLDQMAQALGELLVGLSRGLDVVSLHRIQDGIGKALAQMNAVGAEAERERLAHLAQRPDIGLLLRTLLRLRHDLVMIGRAAANPLPESIRSRLELPLLQAGAAFADYLRASEASLLAGRGESSLNAVDSALDAYGAAVTALRRDGVTQGLQGGAVESFFALGFVLEQMHNDCKDLGHCVAQCAGLSRSGA